jgi:hypothetical protein
MVTFVPFGDAGNKLPADVACSLDRLHRVLPDKVLNLKDEASVAKVVAISFMVPLGFTEAWIDILGDVPSPMTAQYMQGLLERLKEAYRQKKQIFNMQIQCCCSNSYINRELFPRLSDAMPKIKALIRSISEIAANAANCHKALGLGLKAFLSHMEAYLSPKELYMQELGLAFFLLLAQVDPFPDETLDTIPSASGTSSGIAHITGDDVQVLQNNPALKLQRLKIISRTIRQQWSAKGNKSHRREYYEMPVFTMKDLPTQLCEWQKGNYQPHVHEPSTIKEFMRQRC